MNATYGCKSGERLREVELHATLNGIDHLEVVDRRAPAGMERQTTLLVHCLKPLPSIPLSGVVIRGGARVRGIRPLWAHPASALPPALGLDAAERAYLEDRPDADRTLVIRTDRPGDFSTYRLELRDAAGSAEPPTNFDLLLSSVEFRFKVECPSEFDCREPWPQPAPRQDEPTIDYLAKDYESFRRLMLDRLSLSLPEWTERSAADLQMALVELLAYVGDRLSYFQDAVGTEAYLGTARRRVSVRRHARLLDYAVHEGKNARAWVALGLSADPADPVLPAGTQILTGEGGGTVRVEPHEVAELASRGALVFETMHPVALRASRSVMRFHTWSGARCLLPVGATSATFQDDSVNPLDLEPGQAILLEQVKGVESPRASDPDPEHRQAVRLTRVVKRVDPLDDQPVVDVEWGVEDALRFALHLRDDAALARGNVVLADHGATSGDLRELEAVTEPADYRPYLTRQPLTRSGPLSGASARAEAKWDVRTAEPKVELYHSDGSFWRAAPDLLSSNAFDTRFVVETESDGTSHLRFGDDIHGRRPAPGSFHARVRTGNGRLGNVGAGALSRIVASAVEIVDVRNPIPAFGGEDAEALDDVRRKAPTAFQVAERAVTEPDWAEVLERRTDVQRGAATFRWTGSWMTTFAAVDAVGGALPDEDLRHELTTYLDRFRMAGMDLAVKDPRFVAVDLSMRVCVDADHFRAHVHRALLDRLGSGVAPDGRRGLFHPDHFSFASPVFLSRIVEAAMEIAGVVSVEVLRFQRLGRLANGELESGILQPSPWEIARLDNDRNFPENGRIALELGGGR